MVTGQDLQADYELANNYWGLTEAHLLRAVSNIFNSFFQFFLSCYNFVVTGSEFFPHPIGVKPSVLPV
jgi:hypothetical protein